jgi:uncharacterized cupin superfamily protein/RimJ/RimL family protein N-acetyltransferase
MRPDFIGHYTDFMDDDNSTYPGSDELLAIGSAVGKKLGLQKIGIHIETILPGRRTSWPHAESTEEEFAFVLEGSPDAWVDGNLYPLKPGDFVAFPSGTGVTHTFLNNSKNVARMLVGGERPKKDNKIYYPLSESQNQVRRDRGDFWEDFPKKPLGTHDGLPDLLRSGEVTKWNLPVLKSERLILRAIETTDAKAIYQYASNPKVARLLIWEHHKTIADSEAFIKFIQQGYLSGIPNFAICLKENPSEMIGSVGAMWVSEKNKTMELGIALGEEHWGKSYSSEAMLTLIKFLWESFDVERIQSQCKSENLQSKRMMEKMGMIYEGLLRKNLFCKGVAWDMEMFSFVRT